MSPEGDAYEYLIARGIGVRAPLGSAMDTMTRALAQAVAKSVEKGVPLEEVCRHMPRLDDFS